MPRTIVVIPCYNEAERLSVSCFADFARSVPDVEFLFVNDGSSDRTLEVLADVQRGDRSRFGILDQQPNRGKAEAVRVGMQAAFERQPAYAGYWDADLSTPLEEIPRFVEFLETHREREIVFGSRVLMLGRSIERSALRHYVGRLFATLASATLGLPVYDTQCGAKLFRATPAIAALFEEPFCARWSFDVELAARLIRERRGTPLPGAHEAIYELPLHRWHDRPGSKVRPWDLFAAVADLARIRRRYLGRARTQSG